MKIKITFHDMPHSAPIEAHIHQKLERVARLLKESGEHTPYNIEMWVHGKKPHADYRSEIKLKTHKLDLNAHDFGTELYITIDTAIDKLIRLINKTHEKLIDKIQKKKTEKNNFIEDDDKYTLSD